ncbi:MAG: DUF533 domain-containing protein [Holophagales bacterium]|nr:DUF533 domain-containing protein [Holophagales bacterium]
MDPSRLVLGIARAALGGGKKKAGKARGFLSSSGLLTPASLLGAAGVAWGVWETLQAKGGGPGGVLPVPPTPPTLPPPPGPALAVPARAAAVAEAPFPPEALRLVRLALSAARADGVLSDGEREALLAVARAEGAEDAVAAEIARPTPLTEILRDSAPSSREELYVLAFTVVRADEGVSGSERVYLAHLASRLGLTPDRTAALEARTAAAIDAAPAS